MLFNQGTLTLTLTDSTFSGSSGASFGDALYNSGGTITLINSTVSGNSSWFFGGIENNGGTLHLINSTFSDNTASAWGGGIGNQKGATLTLVNSTISGNSASDGGVIENNRSSTVTLTNSTVSGNSASRGGGINNRSDLSAWDPDQASALTLVNSTVTHNSTSDAGGIRNQSSNPVNFKNTIIAGNSAVSTGPDCDGTLTSQDFNLVQNVSGCTITGSNNNNIIIGQDPLLDPLALNTPDTTETHALGTSSPVIDAGNPATPAESTSVRQPTSGASPGPWARPATQARTRE